MINWNDERAGNVLSEMANNLPIRYGMPPDAIGILAMKYAAERLKELAKQNTEGFKIVEKGVAEDDG